jgi:hypothetical protein
MDENQNSQWWQDRAWPPVTKRILCTAAALMMLTVPAVAHAGEMPDDIWSGKYGGHPSIIANSESGVSMTFPAHAVEQAGGGSIAQIAKSFLDRWGPGICSGAFDFQSPHKELKVGVALLKPAGPAVVGGSPGELYEVSTYSDVVIDYTPNRKVTCVKPAELSS